VFKSESPSKFHACALHIISIPNHCISSHSIPLNLNTKKFIPKHIQPTAVSGSLLDPNIITKIWYELEDSTHRQPQQILHNTSHTIHWTKKGVENSIFTCHYFCIRSLHNLNHVLVVMQITLAYSHIPYFLAHKTHRDFFDWKF